MNNESRRLPELFGSMVFDEETMKDRLLEMAQTVIKRNRNGEDQSKKNII